MVDSRIGKLEDQLRARVGRFVANRAKWCSSIHEALRRIRKIEPGAFLCGGAVRDILLSDSRNHVIPRDLDIVLRDGQTQNVADSFSDCTKRWNCYGGVSIHVRDWSIDAWPLEKTWAFQKKYVDGRGFGDFPKSTFLNIEAVAIQLFCRKGQKRAIYSNGFFEAILNRTIEINLKENPNPATSVVRSLSVAKRFQFAIGPKLAGYITHCANQIGPQQLLELYQGRYRPAGLSVNELWSYIKAIEEQLRISAREPVRLPVSDYERGVQSELWSG